MSIRINHDINYLVCWTNKVQTIGTSNYFINLTKTPYKTQKPDIRDFPYPFDVSKTLNLK